ncbi:MAG TPA: cytochrome c3 family protein, partial [Verrucomicrobiae bacterium]
MPQIFRRRANSIARASIVLLFSLAAAGGWVLDTVYWSPWTTRQMVPLDQPAPFSHKHHVYGLGIDCRYCHTSVEKSSFAGVPPTETCMTCHSQIWKDAP